MAHAVTHSRTKHTYTHTKIVREIDDTRGQTVRENSTQTADCKRARMQDTNIKAHSARAENGRGVVKGKKVMALAPILL